MTRNHHCPGAIAVTTTSCGCQEYRCMGIEEEVVTAAEDILKQNATGLTKEALVRQVEPRLPHRLLPAQVIGMLRKQPQRFVEGGDGRWRLREQVGLSDLDDPRETTYETAASQRLLRQGSYV